MLWDNWHMKYFKKHPAFTASVHFVGGVGLGVLIARPVFAAHPIRWGVILVGLAVLGHIYAWFASK
jgi:hypothetical protein